MADIFIKDLNNVYCKVRCSPSIRMELVARFSFKADDYWFDPRFKAGAWDGTIKLFNGYDALLYRGLVFELINFAKENGYTVEIDDEIDLTLEFSLKEATEFIKELKLPFTPYDYQLKAFVHSIRRQRQINLMATNAGKSLTIFLLTKILPGKTLIVVPTVNLVDQMAGDFDDYSVNTDWKSEDHCQLIMEGADKKITKDIVISTWQSIYKMDNKWLSQFHNIIGDEVHLFTAKCLKGLMESCNAVYRIGFTGTLDEAKVNKMTLTGLFGPVKTYIRNKEMIDRKIAVEMPIKCIQLVHSNFKNEIDASFGGKLTYQQEIDHLSVHEKRNKFISNLALSFKNNTMILVSRVNHGKEIVKHLDKNVDKQVFMVYAKTPRSEVKELIELCENNDNIIIVTTFKKFATGTNIKNLHHIIFAAAYKAKITTLQAIGRGLRKHHSKTECILYDLSDNFGYMNNTRKHASERIDIYEREEFTLKMYKVKI